MAGDCSLQFELGREFVRGSCHMEEADETSSSSTSRRSPENARSHNFKMDQGGFVLWQQRFHQQQRMEMQQQNVIEDSQHGFGGMVGGGSSGPGYAQNSHLSDEEFARLMENPMPGYLELMQGGTATGHHRQSFSCPAPTTGLAFENSTQELPNSVATLPAEKKKRATKASAPRPKKAKKPKQLSDDDGEAEESIGSSRWTEAEVLQLIAFRQQMDDEFDRNAKKQDQLVLCDLGWSQVGFQDVSSREPLHAGINSWDKLQALMVAACENFSKTAEACRKKWKTIYKIYQNDKRLLQISGEGRKIMCKYFDQIDEGFNNRSNVRKLAHGDSRGTSNPCPPDSEVGDDGHDSGEQARSETPSAGSNPRDTSPQSAKPTKKSAGEIVSTAIAKLVGHTASIASDIHETTGVLKGLKSQLERMIDKM